MGRTEWKISIEELANATSGRVLSSTCAHFTHIGTDTREELKGKLFVPLKGDSFDAHDFVAKAIEQGASAVLVHEFRDEWRPLLQKASFVQVADTLRGLQDLGHFWRRECGFKVLAITGSNGKTSTKEFTLSLLKDFTPTSASIGSYNNHWGVPRSILNAGPQHKVVILEMGMNHAGEIKRLCEIAEPDVATVTTVGRAHIGELGSIEKVAEAKAEIYLHSPKATHIYNLDNEWTSQMRKHPHTNEITFSCFDESANVRMRGERMSWDGLELTGSIMGVQGTAKAQVLGRHNITNLMAAAALAQAAGMPPTEIWRALGEIRNIAWGRNQMLRLQGGTRVLFDAYNANPDSLEALFKNLYEMDFSGAKFLVAGDMRELGSYSAEAHTEAGRQAAQVGFRSILFLGEHGEDFRRGLKESGAKVGFHTSAKYDEKLAAEFLRELGPEDLVAFKASRGVKLEKVLEAWPLATPLGTKP